MVMKSLDRESQSKYELRIRAEKLSRGRRKRQSFEGQNACFSIYNFTKQKSLILIQFQKKSN